MPIVSTEEEIYKTPMLVFRDDVLKYGWEKAVILGELPHCRECDGSEMKEKNLHKRFPFFTKERFHEILEELLSMNLIVRVGDNSDE